MMPLKFRFQYFVRALSLWLGVAIAFACCAETLRSDGYPVRDAVEYRLRGGLPNFFDKLERGDLVTVAYLGGSITAQQGWRGQSLQWFRNEFPSARVREINAAIGGTGSSLGVFRVQKDVLDKSPDLLFVEFAVNDATASAERIIRAMEGIVRKAWAANPGTDICFVYMLTFRDSPLLAEGKMTHASSVMEAVADHYGIPSVNVGLAVAEMERDAKLVMRTSARVAYVSGETLNEGAAMARDEIGRIVFSKDGVHPYPETGHVLYTEALIRAMNAMRLRAGVELHQAGNPLDEGNWEHARQYPVRGDMVTGDYEHLDPAQEAFVARFRNRLPQVLRLFQGAELHFRFKGTKAMVYDVRGPDGAVLEITVDGHASRVIRMDGYSTYHRLGVLEIADGLDDVVHDVTIRVLGETLDKESILFEHNREDLRQNPQKYAQHYWHPGAILVVGELVSVREGGEEF